MQSYVLVALLAAFIHAFSSVYSKRLYVLRLRRPVRRL